jgi:hypothetical protein
MIGLVKARRDAKRTQRARVLAIGPEAMASSQEGVSPDFGGLRHVLLSYMKCYNEAGTHLSLNKDAPAPRAVERAGHILCRSVLCGLHHQCVRI